MALPSEGGAAQFPKSAFHDLCLMLRPVRAVVVSMNVFCPEYDQLRPDMSLSRLNLLTAMLCVAAGMNSQTPPVPTPEDAVRSILNEAAAAPAEVFSDIAFEISERKTVNLGERARLLEDVFHRAGEAREPFPLVYAGSGQMTAALSAVAASHALKLDALSIRCRAVRAMLQFDPKRARELFEDIPRVDVPRPSCDRQFVPDASVYLETLAAVVNRGAFTKQEREKKVPWWMLENGARGAGSSWQVVAAMRMLPSFARSDEEARLLATALSASLAITDSDRAFTSALQKGELVSEVLAASTKLRHDGASDLPMLSGLREFLARHLSAVRCKDVSGRRLEGIDRFNAAVRERADVRVFTEQETKPASFEDEAPRSNSQPSAEFEEFLREVEQLGRVQSGESLWTVRLTPEWTFRALQVLSKIQDWKGAPGQDSVELFHEKASLLWKLFDVVPAGRTFETVLSEMIALFEDSSILQRRPAEWIAELRRLQAYQRVFTPEALQALRSSGVKQEGLPFTSGLEISEAISASRNGVTLDAAKRNFTDFGASEPEALQYVRAPLDEEIPRSE